MAGFFPRRFTLVKCENPRAGNNRNRTKTYGGHKHCPLGFYFLTIS